MNICIFGDSIAWGMNDLEKGGWAERLKMYYLGKDDDARIYNLGVRSDTTANVLERFESEVSSRKSDTLIFAIGINDTKYTDTTNLDASLKKFTDNILQITQKVKKITTHIIIVGLTRVDESKTNPTPWDGTTCFSNEVIEKYDSELKKHCDKEKMQYIEIKNVLSNNDLDDGLHPNAEGHEKMFQKIKSSLTF